MTPAQRYQQDIESGELQADQAQAEAIRQVQILFEQLLQADPPSKGLWHKVQRLFGWQGGKVDSPQGIYFHGGVGRGKTCIMDIFYESLPFEQKLRTHFHRFMQRVHAELASLQQQKNPLETVALRLAREARVICFDEFFVSDIGDAMILGGLLEHLVTAGVVLVATSNTHPDRLYENGLQRERFLPAIALLHQHTRIIHLDGGTDYRLRTLQQAALYHTPLGAESEQSLRQGFRKLVSEHAQIDKDCRIEVLGRDIEARFCADDVVWFDFKALCSGPRSAFDYIELARLFHTFIVSDIPAFGAANDDMARRFISLVDELYDHNAKLMLSAAVPLHGLYREGSLATVFERTLSRLLEMQSHEYLARAHKP
ncbi:MAG: cell division protein ZapE [Pseudomonadales bacterium]|nr:cell division protein ZapE [Pseudomonadales bacterium]